MVFYGFVSAFCEYVLCCMIDFAYVFADLFMFVWNWEGCFLVCLDLL